MSTRPRTRQASSPRTAGWVARAGLCAAAACAPAPPPPLAARPAPAKPPPAAPATEPTPPPSPAPPASAERPREAEERSCLGSRSSRSFSHAFSPDGDAVAIACFGRVEVHEPATRSLRSALSIDGRLPRNAFRADGKALALFTSSGPVMWELGARETQPFPLPAGGKSFWLSPGATHVAVMDTQGSITVADASTGTPVGTFTIPSSTTGLSLSHDGAMAATASDDEVAVWNTRTGERLRQLRCPKGEVLDRDPPAWTRRRTVLFRCAIRTSTSGEGRVRSYDAQKGLLLGTWSANHFAVTADGAALFVSEPGRIVRIHVATGSRRTLVDHGPNEGRRTVHGALAVSPDGRWLATTLSTMGGEHSYVFGTADGQIVF
jgi:WD40 repeat protein